MTAKAVGKNSSSCTCGDAVKYVCEIWNIFLLLTRFLCIKPQPNDRNMPTQHCWAQHVACIWPPCCDMLRRVGCCWLKFDQFQTWANNSQYVATCPTTVAKRTQHVAPNNVATCCVGMLWSFGQGFNLKNEKLLLLIFSSHFIHLVPCIWEF